MFKRYNVDYNVNEKTLDRIGRIVHEVKTILNESEISRKDNFVYCNFDGLTVAGKGIYVTSDNGERTEYAFNLRIDENDPHGISLPWLEYSEGVLDEKGKEINKPIRDSMNRELERPCHQKWQEIVHKKYVECLEKANKTLDILRNLEATEEKAQLFMEKLRDELKTIMRVFGQQKDFVTLKRMTEYFRSKTVNDALYIDGYIICELNRLGYVILDSRRFDPRNPIVFCEKDFHHGIDWRSTSKDREWLDVIERNAQLAYQQEKQADSENIKINTRSGK